jgi:hypothetical protein
MKHLANGVPSLLHKWFDIQAINITIWPILGQPVLKEQTNEQNA